MKFVSPKIYKTSDALCQQSYVATSHVVGDWGIFKGEGSDFVIQAPSPLTIKTKIQI